MISIEVVFKTEYEIRINGAIFWTVIRIMQCMKEIPCIIGGNQKWRGAAPTFNNREMRMNRPGIVGLMESVAALPIITVEPRAWIKKYLRADSEEYEFWWEQMIGTKDKRLSSSPSQLENQELADTAIMVPEISVLKNKIRAGLKLVIKKRNYISYTRYEPVSLILAYLFTLVL